MIEGASSHYQRIYEMGFEARSARMGDIPPDGLSFQGQHWWLAGYQDRDIELAGPDTQVKVAPSGKP